MTSEARRARLAAGARWSALLVLAAAALLFPVLFSNPVVTNYGVYALIFVTAASAWNVFSGFSGYISLGQAVFFGSGAYAVGIAAAACWPRRARWFGRPAIAPARRCSTWSVMPRRATRGSHCAGVRRWCRWQSPTMVRATTVSSSTSSSSRVRMAVTSGWPGCASA